MGSDLIYILAEGKDNLIGIHKNVKSKNVHRLLSLNHHSRLSNYYEPHIV